MGLSSLELKASCKLSENIVASLAMSGYRQDRRELSGGNRNVRREHEVKSLRPLGVTCAPGAPGARRRALEQSPVTAFLREIGLPQYAEAWGPETSLHSAQWNLRRCCEITASTTWTPCLAWRRITCAMPACLPAIS